jgi:hypothetical protein
MGQVRDMAKGTCSLCPRPLYGHDYCAPHWKRWYKTGDPQPDIPIGHRYSQTPAERFWAKVDKNGPVPAHAPELGPCWVWTASTWEGYGSFRGGKKKGMDRAHVWAWEQEKEPVPEGLEIDHLCRNKACVRVSHLDAVTHLVNLERMVTGITQIIRETQASTLCRKGLHPLGPPGKNGKRCCKICQRDRDAERRAERMARELEGALF